MSKKKGLVMKVLALDLSTHSSGWAGYNGSELSNYGLIKANSKDLIDRIHKIINQLYTLLSNSKPDIIVIEEVRPPQENGQNVKTFKALSYLQAALVFLVHEHFKEIKIEFMYPSEWRKICGIQTGRGIQRKSLKEKVIKFVNDTFDMNTDSDDIADAVGLGWGYLNKPKELNWE
ncbi:MAG: crossover junction endodeoxyribonuclease [Caudoviricetes sp.]|nr:MAG: crossover junction endodeoxyribonuclease [Caudoviricetes sp.]